MELFDANEETGRRICILFEFLQGKPVYESYLNLCNKIGKDTIQFKDFDFWYHRFANGKLDLGYDISLEPEKKGINDIPMETLDKILNEIEHPIEKMQLRKVCRNFKNIIDIQNSREKKLIIDYYSEFVQIQMEGKFIYYCPTKKGCSVDVDLGGRYSDMFFKGRNFVKMAFGHIEYLLKLPNLKLDEFGMDEEDINEESEKRVWLKGTGINVDFLGYVDDEDSDDGDDESTKVIKPHNRIDSLRIIAFLVAVLESLTHQIHTKSISFDSIIVEDVARILKFCKPGVLESIKFRDLYDGRDEEQEKILVESEQWKQAMDRSIAVDFNCLPFFLRHSDTINITFLKLIPDEIVRIRETIYTIPNFKHCRISTYSYSYWEGGFSFEEIYSALGTYTEITKSPERRTYKIPGSEDLLEFVFEMVLQSIYLCPRIDIRKIQ
ncbi:unnamed protein product [Caenorhabditis brenneri]